MKKITLVEKGKLHKKAWKIFSIWVRQSEADWKGYCKCVSCGKSYLWNSGMIHAGHFHHDKLDFDPVNVHAQCRDCNYKYNKHAQAYYGVWMCDKYGREACDELRKRANKKGNLYSYTELKKIIHDYQLLPNQV